MIHTYASNLTESQKRLIRRSIPELFERTYRYDTFEILNAILYLVKTGCQWKMLPHDFPKWRCVYNHYRGWGERGIFAKLMHVLTAQRRKAIGREESPSVAVLDSQSVKWGLIQSEKGIDGGKKVKGIKRHLVVDSAGLPLSIGITRANIHDTAGAIDLLSDICHSWPTVIKVKADMGYRGLISKLQGNTKRLELQCVKSNFGTSEFIPVDGRWVVERTFSWMDSFRRINRNYERYLKTASIVTTLALCSFLLKYFT